MAIGHAKNRTTKYGTWHFLCGRLVGTSWLVEPLVFICRRHSSGSLIPPTFYLEEIWWRVALYSGLLGSSRQCLCHSRHPCVHAGTFTIGVLERLVDCSLICFRYLRYDCGSRQHPHYHMSDPGTQYSLQPDAWFSFYIQVQLSNNPRTFRPTLLDYHCAFKN